MKLSTDRILTTHVGSLPRPLDLSDMLLKKEFGETLDQAAFEARARDAVREVVQKQVDAGIDIISDGEMSKIGYATYIKDRCTGFSGTRTRSSFSWKSMLGSSECSSGRVECHPLAC